MLICEEKAQAEGRETEEHDRILILQTNLDDPTGDYAVVCRDRASGLVARAVIQRQNRRLKTSLSPDRQ